MMVCKNTINTNDGIEEIKVKDVLYTSNGAANLLSVSKMVEKGLSVIFTPEKYFISNGGTFKNSNHLAAIIKENGI